MSADVDLRALLAADATTASLVGTRISQDFAGQASARPLVVFAEVASVTEYGLDNSTHGRKTSFEVQCVADTRLKAKQVGDAVRAAIEGAFYFVTNRTTSYDGDLDIAIDQLSVDWWED